jgi:hypothetical protein
MYPFHFGPESDNSKGISYEKYSFSGTPNVTCNACITMKKVSDKSCNNCDTYILRRFYLRPMVLETIGHKKAEVKVSIF